MMSFRVVIAIAALIGTGSTPLFAQVNPRKGLIEPLQNGNISLYGGALVAKQGKISQVTDASADENSVISVIYAASFGWCKIQIYPTGLPWMDGSMKTHLSDAKNGIVHGFLKTPKESIKLSLKVGSKYIGYTGRETDFNLTEYFWFQAKGKTYSGLSICKSNSNKVDIISDLDFSNIDSGSPFIQ